MSKLFVAAVFSIWICMKMFILNDEIDVIATAERYHIEFVEIPGNEQKDKIVNIVRERLELIGSPGLEFKWDDRSILYFRLINFKDQSLIAKYVGITGKLRFSIAESRSETGFYVLPAYLDIVAVEIGEPSKGTISFKFNRSPMTNHIACKVDDMVIGIIEMESGSDRGVAQISDSLAKLISICHRTGEFPVLTLSNVRIEDYSSSDDLWFPIPKDLRRKLLDNSANFKVKPVLGFPPQLDFHTAKSAGFTIVPESRAYMSDLNFGGRSIGSVVVEGTVNMTGGYIEVAASCGTKLHESLINLSSSIRMLDLAVSLAGIQRNEQVGLFVQWRKGEEVITYRLDDLIIDIAAMSTVSEIKWSYQYEVFESVDPVTGNTYELPRSFISGLVATTIRDKASMFDNSMSDESGYDDYRFVPNFFVLPEPGTRISFVIAKSE